MLETSEHVQPLRDFSAALVERRRGRNPTIEVPDFDPADAGVSARVLLLFESPGDKTLAGPNGSGFISADNDDETAKNVWEARDAEGMHEGVAAWNIVPWFLGIGDKSASAEEVGQGAMELRLLLPIFADLEAVVLCGAGAKSGWKRFVSPHVDDSRLTVIETWNPAPRTFAQAGKQQHFRNAMHRAAPFARK